MTPRKPRPANAEKPARAPEETLERIVREEMNIETLKTRNSDSLDIHEVAVWQLRDALEAAYQAGIRAANSPRSS
ncbi:DUF6900 domain-containing protein [Corallococcus exiguus]|uniref:DUF6900 domain-containing protein n=1 Tax=Corallococcus exiguus TaxID=83462 RepID=A0A7X5BUP7_9BACT|nr:hypothetical protein [Corallococcus exiguus]NBC41417.1 hypothetical protein [Corallococcus exiguus]TNV67123.1 hypothetical protein FH620_02560 [Corallococcus exiguus]